MRRTRPFGAALLTVGPAEVVQKIHNADALFTDYALAGNATELRDSGESARNTT
jgi:hypothetical protein